MFPPFLGNLRLLSDDRTPKVEILPLFNFDRRTAALHLWFSAFL